MRTRRFAALLAAFLAVSAAATAGVALASRTGSSPIQQAAAKSSKASSVKFDFTIAISGAGASIPGGKLSLGGSGAVDSRHKSADFKLDLSSLAPLLSGVTKGAAVPKSIELVVVKNAIYLDFPALAAQLGAKGKSWVKFDTSKLPKSVTGGVNPKAASSVSPQQALAALQSALSVHKVGSDHHGTHYHGAFNLSALVGIVPKSQQASLRTSLAKYGVKSVPFDAWVGHGGYLSRLAVALSVKAQKGQPPARIAFAINLHDYGSAVHISAPPAGQTADGSKLLASLSGLTGG